MATADAEPKAAFAKRLARAGYEDFLILDHEAATRVLTPKRRELLETVRAADIESITDLAERVDRDVAAVHRDLDTLFENGLIEYESADGAKVPRSRHEHVFVQPLF